jgi:uncharacterized protein (UPF0212 family)
VSRALLQQALKALEYAADKVYCETNDDAIGTAITAIRKELETIPLDNTKEQEPVAWVPLADSQWVNIVNAKSVLYNEDKEGAVNNAVKMTEERLKQNNLHPAPIPPGMVLVPEEQLAALEAENAELRKDAERYRWIRNNDYLSVMDCAKWEYLDAAIDAAKEAQS